MANSISINSDMTKLIFTSGSTTTELDLAGDGIILRLANGDVGADSATSIITSTDFTKSTVDSLWTVGFNETNKKVFFIGVDDVDVSITTPTGHQFDLNEVRVNIRRSEDTLTVASGV